MARKKKNKFDEVWDGVKERFPKLAGDELDQLEEHDHVPDDECEACTVGESDVYPAEEEEYPDIAPLILEEELPDDEYQTVEIDEILNIENEVMFRTVDPKLIEPYEAIRLKKKAGELLRKAVSGSENVPVKQMMHWQRVSEGKFPWGWKVEEE